MSQDPPSLTPWTVITTILTFLLTTFSLLLHFKPSNPFSSKFSTLKRTLHLIFEVLILLLWIASAALLLRYPKSCGFTYDGKCWKTESHTFEWKDLGDRPLVEWDAGIALGFAEM